jgi:DNA-binding XRE family transcriptional regulator
MLTNQDDDEKEKLTPAQTTAVALLAVGDTLTGAAERLNVSRQTISKWLNQDQDFQIALKEKQAEIFEDEVRRVKGMTARALEVIYEGLENENYRFRLMSAVKLLSAVNIGKLIAEANKPPPLPPAVISHFCPDCDKRHEAKFFADLAEMDL